jgi:hypothetical protein
MGHQQHIMKSWQYTLCLHITDLFICTGSVLDPDPQTFGWIRIRFGSEYNILDPYSNHDSNADPKPETKQTNF